MDNSGDRGYERVGDRDHLVAGTDACREHRDVQGVVAAADAHRLASTNDSCQVALEVM